VADSALVRLLCQAGVPAQAGSQSVFEAGGCAHCRMSGYHGRLVIMEILAMHADMDEMLMHASPMQRIQQQARQHGYTTLAEEGLQLVGAGETSLQELHRVVDLSAFETVAAMP